MVLLVAFLVVGPKDLPKVARWLGRNVKRMRQLIREIKQETGWDEFEKEISDTKSQVDGSLKELKQGMDIAPELKGAAEDVKKGVSGIQREVEQVGKQIKKLSKD